MNQDRLGDIANATYRRHITMRAARLGVAERDLSYAVAWRGVLESITSEDAATEGAA